jgi:hypothetical protein
VLRAAEGCSGYVETSSFAEDALEQNTNPESARALGIVLSEAERALARAFDGLTVASVVARSADRGAVPDYQI